MLLEIMMIMHLQMNQTHLNYMNQIYQMNLQESNASQ